MESLKTIEKKKTNQHICHHSKIGRRLLQIIIFYYLSLDNGILKNYRKKRTNNFIVPKIVEKIIIF